MDHRGATIATTLHLFSRVVCPTSSRDRCLKVNKVPCTKATQPVKGMSTFLASGVFLFITLGSSPLACFPSPLQDG